MQIAQIAISPEDTTLIMFPSLLLNWVWFADLAISHRRSNLHSAAEI